MICEHAGYVAGADIDRCDRKISQNNEVTGVPARNAVMNTATMWLAAHWR
jgi:hypothetical protein